jgi:hypothetical protein
MRGAVPPFLQYAFVAWCPVKAQGLYLSNCIMERHRQRRPVMLFPFRKRSKVKELV